MPLVKRNIEPRHLCRGGLPEGIGSELECVTNNTLSAIIRQLSSLSKHAEDVFGELFSEANTFYVRANGLQDRIDRLAVKVTQLDSTVEEVSLQDINMRKAFKSSTVQDQQVVSKSSTSNPVEDMYNTSDKPPSLSILSAYRDDHTDGMKFYTDPSYFFDLWKEKMLQDTEDKRKERRRQREQKRCVDGTLQREVKKVRKARNRRQEWNMMAFDKELRPDHRHPHSLHRGVSSEGSLSPESRYGHDLPDYPTAPGLPHSASNHALAHPYPPADIHESVEHEYHSIGVSYREGTLNRTHHSPPLHRSTERINGTMTLPPADYSIMEYYASSGPPPPPPAPLIPSAQTAFGSPMVSPTPLTGSRTGATGYGLPPLPPPGPRMIPPPPGPPPPPVPPAPPQLAGLSDGKRQDTQPRSDLLSAIRMGIQLKKVQEQQEQQAKREPVGNDVATILSRRIAVEYSDSEDDSELEENDWSD
ncbi:wiskott-Aldrich syndrome protein family member 3-like isoform X1 [Oncorhynchus mykiss]|uniref:Wiskott-Aldrich syndrome protein family member n=1 Tax=Oncorhynchus mykiss TaxID=8022 RepID=A0A8C7V8K5_ONCMY|nr:wiskott-Aldrich syndrome protein family member 3-like isoform X1 [Oncorhynchus mykiss]XP_036846393.1 wiskott-Aldrich syndrome protein family member 3-like isoform X1 [Oncorhynchus mykiss]XP_036846394.1 wiskott-Aldrich syndrome protein family member 3-like isoform X1 [Oncorhynchus mykiss]XP_036846395.1 wiskott-Aldrich syndrome protein family member 3-like isoform X1 [Oncorhynchus mykiss]